MALLVLPRIARSSTSLDSIDLSRHGEITEIHVGLAGSPPRITVASRKSQLWVDFAETNLNTLPHLSAAKGPGPVQNIGARELPGSYTRIVVEVAGRTDFAYIERPGEMVLRFAPAGRVANLSALGLEEGYSAGNAGRGASSGEPTIAAPQVYSSGYSIRQSQSPPVPGNAVVMIDPGHGGYDPGTHSDSGVPEKDLALSVAQRVAAALRARGVRAEMTRDGDYFISLPERTRRANAANADLFVSIHMNWSPNPETTGIEVYYLNNSTDRATIRLARMENGAVTGAGTSRDGDLNYILADLTQNYKANEAASLARMIDTETVNDLAAETGASVPALGAKQGPFYVLVGAAMPAVLVECGFLSNSSEASRLNSSQYQDVLAEGIATAIVQYLGTAAPVGTL